MQYHLARMTPAELQAQIEKAPLVILPVGSIEWHGPHLPIGLDALKVEALAESLAARNGVAVAPAIFYGACETIVRSKGFPGTLEGIEQETLKNYVVQIGLGIYKMGFRALFILSGHYEPCQVKSLELAAEELRASGGRVRFAIEEDFTKHLAPGKDSDPPTALTYRWRGGHAGEFETSIMLKIAPELVHMSDAPEELRIDIERTSDGLPIPRHVQLSHPAQATKEQGIELFDVIMSGGAEVIKELLSGF